MLCVSTAAAAAHSAEAKPSGHLRQNCCRFHWLKFNLYCQRLSNICCCASSAPPVWSSRALRAQSQKESVISTALLTPCFGSVLPLHNRDTSLQDNGLLALMNTHCALCPAPVGVLPFHQNVPLFSRRQSWHEPVWVWPFLWFILETAGFHNLQIRTWRTCLNSSLIFNNRK